jgi:hypothetical protein
MTEGLADAFDAACMGFSMATPAPEKKRRGGDSPLVATAAGREGCSIAPGHSRDMSPPGRNVGRRGVSCGDATSVAPAVEMPAPLQTPADSLEGLATPPRPLIHRFLGPQKICHDTKNVLLRTIQSFAPDYHQFIWCYVSSPAYPLIRALTIAQLHTRDASLVMPRIDYDSFERSGLSLAHIEMVFYLRCLCCFGGWCASLDMYLIRAALPREDDTELMVFSDSRAELSRPSCHPSIFHAAAASPWLSDALTELYKFGTRQHGQKFLSQLPSRLLYVASHQPNCRVLASQLLISSITEGAFCISSRRSACPRLSFPCVRARRIGGDICRQARLEQDLSLKHS